MGDVPVVFEIEGWPRPPRQGGGKGRPLLKEAEMIAYPSKTEGKEKGNRQQL